MPKITTQARLSSKRKEYAEKYNLDDLKSGNDKANLELLLNYEVTIENLTDELHEAQDKGDTSTIATIIKTIDSILESKLKLEKSLGIDRVARKKESNADSPAEYITRIKAMAVEFLEQRLTKLNCPECNIMVGRFAPVHEHTKFDVRFKCSQCGKLVTAKREDRDVFYDLKASDREWRKRYPVSIVQSKSDTTDDVDSEDDEMVIG